MNIALVAPELQGHLNPMTTLGRELADRGNRVTLFGSPQAESKVLRAGLGFHLIGGKEYETGEAQAAQAKLASLTGFAALRFTGKLLREACVIGLRDLPGALKEEKIDAMVVDQVSPAAACIADVSGMPFVLACNAMAMHQEPGVPPGTLSWPYRKGFLARLRNRMGNVLLRIAGRQIFRDLAEHRAKYNLPPYRHGLNEEYGLAHIAQQPSFFDFPRERLPKHFHYTGPWHRPGRDQVAFPWEKLDGRPLVYASLGTLQNRLDAVFQAILQGCAKLPVQVVLSLGRADANWNMTIPENAIVVPFAPQLELLERSSVVITHAGLNTVLETLAQGKPMLCMPITNDQPGVANRVRWLGAGRMLKFNHATAERVKSEVETLRKDAKYRTAAEGCRDTLAGTHGLTLAGDIVERAFRTGKKVVKET
jgi:MGT family glycosyltransferase